MDGSLNVALVQTTISAHTEENLRSAHSWIEEAAATRADLVVFPEMFMALPEKDTILAEIAEPLDGPFVSTLCQYAAASKVSIICGMWQQVDGEKTRAANVIVAIGPDGTLLAHYNKIHLFDALNVRESDTMIGGHNPPPIININGLNLGLAICYDLRFPELFRNLASRGADGAIIPSAWYAGPMKEAHWLTLLRARAIENTMYICGANLCGEPFAARSAIYDPFGAALAGTGEQEGLVCGRLERSRIDEIRAKLPCLANRRGELFRD